MTKQSKLPHVLALVAIVIAIVACGFAYQGSQSFGATNSPTRFPNGYLDTGGGYYVDGTAVIDGSGNVKLGGGTVIDAALTGTCTLVSDASIAATSTGTGTCTISGLAAGDQVFLQLASTTPVTNLGVTIVGASVNAGATGVAAKLLNLTGGAVAPASMALYGSSTHYWIVRD